MRSRYALAALAVLCLSLLAAGCASKKTTAQAHKEDEQARLYREKLEKAANELNAVIYFDFDKHALKPDARRILTRKAAILQEFPEIRLEIAGNGDEWGTNEYNLGLGKRRAQATADFLVKQGVDPSRLIVVSYGKDRPQDPSHNKAAWAKNRYVEFKAKY